MKFERFSKRHPFKEQPHLKPRTYPSFSVESHSFVKLFVPGEEQFLNLLQAIIMEGEHIYMRKICVCVCVYIYMKVLIDQSYLTLGDPMSPGGVALQAPLSKEFSKQVGSHVIPFSRGSSRPGVEPKSPTLQVGSLPSEPPGKPSCIHTYIYTHTHTHTHTYIHMLKY